MNQDPSDSFASENSGSPPGTNETVVQDENERVESRKLSSDGANPPTQVTGYEILRRLGAGAFGSVWLAREQNTGKAVAIKFYSHRQGLDQAFLSREVEKLAVLHTSRHIVRLLDVGWSSHPPYYIMEFLENGSLDRKLAAGALPADQAIRLIRGIVLALVHAHGSGVLHCDLKPANILLDADFEPRLCDFGQSRLTHEQKSALGTLFYMAPEQASPDAIPDARWDVYALGSLLYQMLTGQPPYRTTDNEQRIRETETLPERLATYQSILRESPRPQAHREQPGVDRRLADIVDRCLHKDPKKRFPNAQAVLDVIELRERQRSRRPLIALGIVGPALLLITMAMLVGDLMRNVVSSTRQTQTNRALESNALPARILARSLRQELETRQRELEGIAADPDLRRLIEDGMASGQRDQLVNTLNEIKRNAQDHLVPEDRDTSWFLTDSRGFQRWRNPPSSRTIDRQFSYRDYFHGQNKDFVNHSKDQEPIKKPHISIAFRSEANGLYMVAISVPVLSTDGKSVVGVLGRTQELGVLQEQYERFISSSSHSEQRVIALVDRRAGWRLIDHPWMTREHLEDHAEQNDLLRLDEKTVSVLERHFDSSSDNQANDFRLDDYSDPVTRMSAEASQQFGQKWLAAFCPIGNTGWLAVIQEPRDQAWAPVESMRGQLVGYALGGLVICATLIGILWFFVLRVLTDRSFRIVGVTERTMHGNSRDSNSNGRELS